MANKRNRKTTKPQPKALAKAQAPASVVPSQALLPNYQPEMQKSNIHGRRYENNFAAVKNNSWANRAISVIASSVVANGWKPQPLDPRNPSEEAENKIIGFLSQPNDVDSFEDVITRIVWDLYTCGNSYWEVVRVNASKARKAFYGTSAAQVLAKDSEYAQIIEDAFDATVQQLDGLPIALFYVDPRTVSIQTDKHGRIETFSQTDLSGAKVIFDRGEIMHFKLQGAEPGIYGSSPLESLDLDLTIDLYRQTYTRTMLENSSMLGLFFSMEGAQTDTVARMQEWLNVRARGVVNAGQNVVAEGKLEISAVPTPPVFEEGSSGLGNSLKEKILTCLGVPVAKLGTSDAGSMGGQNQEGSNKSFVENTIKPLARMIERQFNLQLIPDFKVVGVSGYGVAILTEDVDILQTRAETVTSLVNAGIITTNEGRVELKQLPYQDVGDVPMKLTPGGLIKLSDAEADQSDDIAAINAKLTALAGIVGGQSDTEVDNGGKKVTASAPPANAKVVKTLTSLAESLLKIINEPE